MLRANQRIVLVLRRCMVSKSNDRVSKQKFHLASEKLHDMDLLCKHLGQLNYALRMNQYRQFTFTSSTLKKHADKKFLKKEYASDEDMNELMNITKYRELLEKCLIDLQESFVKNLSIRSAAGALENLIVKLDGDEYPLNQLAEIGRKNPHLVVVNVSSFPQAIESVTKAITESGMNLNPQQEGATLYVKIPKVTREHRETLAKNAAKLCNDAKKEAREIQNRFVKDVAKKKKDASEDLIFNVNKQIMLMSEQTNKKLEDLTKNKQDELLLTK